MGEGSEIARQSRAARISEDFVNFALSGDDVNAALFSSCVPPWIRCYS